MDAHLKLVLRITVLFIQAVEFVLQGQTVLIGLRFPGIGPF